MSTAPASVQQLSGRMAKLNINPDDVEETFIRSGGHGGQNVNKTSTCVVLLHRPTQIRVKSQGARQQGQNRLAAWRLLLDKVEALRKSRIQAERAEVEKARRRSRKPSRRARERTLAAKAQQSAKKASRRSVQAYD